MQVIGRNAICSKHGESFSILCPLCFPGLESLLGTKVTKSGVRWPVYHIGKDGIVLCEWANGAISGFGDLAELARLNADGAIIEVKKGLFIGNDAGKDITEQMNLRAREICSKLVAGTDSKLPM